MKNNLKKSFIWNTLGSGAASVISLLYMIVVTRINGTDVAGIFTLCFASACMFYSLSLYCGRTYQVTENDQAINDNDFLYQRIICSFITILAIIIFAIINTYTGTKLIVLLLLCISKIIESISDVYHGYLQKNERLDIVGKSLFLRTILSIIIFVILDILTKNIIISISSIIIINLLTLILIDIKYGNKYKEKIKYNSDSIKKIFIFGFFTFSITFISNYLYNIPRYAIDGVLNDTLQAIYGIIVMPATIIMITNQFVIQPLITILKDNYKNRDKKLFLKLIYKIIGITILIGILSTILGYLVGIDILKILYSVKLDKYRLDLVIIIIGAMFYTISSVFSNALIIIRKTKIQFYIYMFVTLISYFISKYLVNKYLFRGAIFTYLIMMLLLFILYLITFIFIINKEKIWKKEESK